MRTIAADFYFAGPDDVGGIGDLSERLSVVIKEENFQIRIRILAVEVPIRSEGDEASVITKRRLKVSILYTCVEARGRCLRDLFQITAEKKDLRVTVGILAQKIAGGGKNDVRSILRNPRSDRTAERDLQKFSWLGCQAGLKRPEAVCTASARQVFC